MRNRDMDNASTTYAWEGINRKGRRVSGQTKGHNAALVKAQLRQQGISPGRVRKQSPLLPSLTPSVKATDITLFTRQLATLLKAGVPLLQAFDIISEGVDNRAVREQVLGLKQAIAAGSSLAEALRKQLVAAGEQAGALETLLERVAIHREKSEQLKARIKKAMTYPIAVLVVASLVTGILLVHVVPQFQALFAGVDGKLPAFTLHVIALSAFMQHAWWMLVLGIVAGAAGLRQAYRASSGFRRGPLRPHALHDLCRRCSTGPGIGFSRRRRGKRPVQTGNRTYASRCIQRHATESIHAQQRPVSRHGNPTDGDRRRVGHPGTHAGKGRQPL
jgi:type IV pilus assembly protein PilC